MKTNKARIQHDLEVLATYTSTPGHGVTRSSYSKEDKMAKEYLKEEMKPAAGDEVYVCGDSYSDVLGSRRAGTKFIGILTGLEGKKEAALFEREKVPYVDRITDIEKVIDTPSV